MTFEKYNLVCPYCNKRVWTNPAKWDGYAEIKTCTPCKEAIREKQERVYARNKFMKQKKYENRI